MTEQLHPPIQIVDEHDEPLRGGTMDEVQLGGLWHRIARVMVYDKITEKYLLQKVAPNPYYDEGLWNTSSSGHVDVGETYEQAGTRETAEEVGIRGLKLREIQRYRTEQTRQDRIYRRHNATFLAEADITPWVSRSAEVERTAWMNEHELFDLNPRLATGGLRYFITGYLRGKNGN